MYKTCDGKIQGQSPDVLQSKPERSEIFMQLSGKSFTRVSKEDFMNQVSGNNIAIPENLYFGNDGSIEINYSTNFGMCKNTGHWSARDDGVLQIHDRAASGCIGFKVAYLDVLYPVINGRVLKLRTLEADFSED